MKGRERTNVRLEETVHGPHGFTARKGLVQHDQGLRDALAISQDVDRVLLEHALAHELGHCQAPPCHRQQRIDGDCLGVGTRRAPLEQHRV